MIVPIDLGLRSHYSIELVDAFSTRFKTYVYPGAIPGAIVEGLAAQVLDKNGKGWVGCFAAGSETDAGLDYCSIHPDGARLIVVSRGDAYVVSLSDPANWEELSFGPILGSLYDSATNVLFFYDYTRICAIGAEGVMWKTASVSWDGLQNLSFSEGKLTGEGWDSPDGRFVPFEIDVSTGSVEGGAAPPQ